MKIKYANLSKMYNLTACEIDLLIYIARRQNDAGIVFGLYYQDVCRSMGMCKQSFYNALYALEEKQIVQIIDHSQADFDVCFLDNDFSYPEAYREGYIKLNRRVFHSSKFWKMKAKEKWLFLECMKLTHSSVKGCFRIYLKNLYEKYQKLFQVTRKVITGYLHTLKQFFSIGVKNGMYYITYRKKIFEIDYYVSESTQYLSERIRVLFRRNKIKDFASDDIAECVKLVKQYPGYLDEDGRLKQLDRAIRSCGAPISLPYIHMTYRNYLGVQP